MRWRTHRYKFFVFLIFAALFLVNRRITQVEILDEEDEYLMQVEVKEDKKQQTKVECEQLVTETKCSSDYGKSMKCWKDDEDVYFPASFIKKRFEMTGKMDQTRNTFDLLTSYSKMKIPEKKYESDGQFGHFSTYSVETRDRVRCISAKTDVPMSTQWDTVPYYYPIQVAQYGLQHYSKMKSVSDNSSRMEVMKGEKSSEWKGAAGMDDTTERLFFTDPEFGKLVNISAEVSLANAGAYVYLDKSPDLHVVSFEWKPLATNASFTVLAKMRDGDLLVLLNYVFNETSTKCVWSDDENPEPAGPNPDDPTLQKRKKPDGQVSFSYSSGDAQKIGEWTTVSRDILVDAARALSSSESRKKEDNIILHPGDLRVVSIGFRGKLTIRQKIRQSNEHHNHAFEASAKWLLDKQDAEGGWAVPVERAIAERKLVLPPGWRSAMAQGHGLSVLTRAYRHFGDVEYLKAAIRAIGLFQKNSADGGVRADFFGNVWYEEYPTTPGSFVLNGFMYSLIGLYDLSRLKVDPKDANSEIAEKLDLSKTLYENGIQSLRTLLPLFDTGSGTIYDLRHVGLKTAPNLARWDYHAVHVYLLKWLAVIEAGNDTDGLLTKTADRWIGYANGKRAKHN